MHFIVEASADRSFAIVTDAFGNREEIRLDGPAGVMAAAVDTHKAAPSQKVVAMSAAPSQKVVAVAMNAAAPSQKVVAFAIESVPAAPSQKVVAVAA